MRVPLIASALLLTAFAGCAELPQMDLQEFEPYPEASYAPNATHAPPQAPEPAQPALPNVTSIATTPYTAPEPIELALSMEGARLALMATPEGLWCASTPHDDPYAAPAGYKVVSTHAVCRLSADNATFAEARADSAEVDLPLMADIPVDTFRFEMEITRTMVNNTGEHDEVIASYSAPVLAAPDASVEPELPYGMYYGEVCDGPDEWEDQTGPMGVETIVFSAFGHNGRPGIVFEPGELKVLEISGGNWTDNGTIEAIGEWAHESTVELHVTIDFEADGDHISLLPACSANAFEFDMVGLPVTAYTEGIAAGWRAEDSQEPFVEVFLQLF